MSDQEVAMPVEQKAQVVAADQGEQNTFNLLGLAGRGIGGISGARALGKK